MGVPSGDGCSKGSLHTGNHQSMLFPCNCFGQLWKWPLSTPVATLNCSSCFYLLVIGRHAIALSFIKTCSGLCRSWPTSPTRFPTLFACWFTIECNHHALFLCRFTFPPYFHIYITSWAYTLPYTSSSQGHHPSPPFDSGQGRGWRYVGYSLIQIIFDISGVSE